MNWLLLQCLWKKLNLKTLSFTEYMRGEAVNLDHHKGTIWLIGQKNVLVNQKARFQTLLELVR